MAGRFAEHDMALDLDDTKYPNLRPLLDPSFPQVSDRQIEFLLARHSIDADAAEGVFSDVGNFFKKAAPTILPIAGTALGTVFGGPIGASLGGTLGKVAAGALGGQPGGAGAALASGGGAAGKLMSVLGNPSTLQAVGS